MLLPLFPLPSRPTELIQFRQPNIADAMRFNSITPEEQEQQTTAYLKVLLAEPAKYDPLTWTAQDRITGTIDQFAITEEILRKFNQFVKPLLPLHIVFDGLTLYLSVVVNEQADMITLNEISDTEKAFCWFETSDTTSLTGVTSISAPITATPGGTIMKATPTFDRTRADDLLLDSDA